MEFTVRERLQLGALLQGQPEKGSVATFRIVSDLLRELSFSEEEWKEFEIQRPTPTSYQWSEEKEKAKEIAVGEKAFEIIREVFVGLDEKDELPRQQFDLAVRFLGDE